MQAFGQRIFSQVNIKNKKGEKNKLFWMQIRRTEQEVRKRNITKKEWEKSLFPREGKQTKKEKMLKNRIHKTTHGFMKSHMVLLTILKL